jgi:large subunit ribosomal protein L19e
MELDQVKNIAARVMDVGTTRVRIRDAEKAVKAMTRDDIRSLINQGAIEALPVTGVSRFRAKALAAKKKKGRRTGRGTRHGSVKTRTDPKGQWLRQVRALRRQLNVMKPGLNEGAYRKLYMMVKGGYFRSKSHLALYVEEKGLAKK